MFCDVAGSIDLVLASELIVDLVSSDSAPGGTSVMTNPPKGAEGVASFDGPFFFFFLFLFLDLLGFVDKDVLSLLSSSEITKANQNSYNIQN